MIQIDENWRFEREANNYTLEMRKKVAEKIDGKKTGRSRLEWIEVGFFGKIHFLYLEILEADAMAAKSLQEVEERINAMGQKILKTIRENPHGSG